MTAQWRPSAVLFDHQWLPNTNQGLVNNTAASGQNAVRLAEWGARLERLRGHPPPAGFTEANWHQLKLDSLALLQTHGQQLAALGWTTLDLFSLHHTHAGARVSHSGLARFIHGGALIELTDRYARIRRRSGAVLTFVRTDPQSGAVPAWELHPEQRGTTEMAEYTMDLDAGTPDQGPWLRFHTQATQDGRNGPGTWSVRDSAGLIEVNLRDGLVFDWPNSKTGWMRNSGLPGQAPEKRWNASRTKFEAQPDKDWRRAIYVPVAWIAADGQPSRAIWEQANASAWMAYCEAMALIKDGATRELPKLPLLGCRSYRPVQMRAGSTLVPQFTVLRYVARPHCLPEADDDAPVPVLRGNGAMTAQGGSLDDEVPF